MVKPLRPFTGTMAVGTVRVREIGMWWEAPSWVDDLAAWTAACREVAAVAGLPAPGLDAIRFAREWSVPMRARLGVEPAPPPGIALDR